MYIGKDKVELLGSFVIVQFQMYLIRNSTKCNLATVCRNAHFPLIASFHRHCWAACLLPSEETLIDELCFPPKFQQWIGETVSCSAAFLQPPLLLFSAPCVFSLQVWLDKVARSVICRQNLSWFFFSVRGAVDLSFLFFFLTK